MFGRLGKWVRSKIDKVADCAREAYDYLKEGGSKVYHSITGKDKFNEAEALMHEIEDRYDKAKQKYEKSVEKSSLSLQAKINTINYHKKDIFENNFIRFKNIGNRLHNINIEGKSFLEYFDDNITEIHKQEGVRTKHELYEIDFNNLSLKEIGLGLITLGFFTRKKAKQTLIKVQEEERRIDEEIEKMKTQVKKLKVIEKSIDNVAKYFETLIQNYTKLLDRFEFGISSQILKSKLNNQILDNGKLDFKLMPIIHIEEFQALFNLSVVLKQMATMGYLTEDCKIVDENIRDVNNIQSKVAQLEILAA
jgi:hypothetical protein